MKKKIPQPISVAAVAVDVVIFTIKDGTLQALLIYPNDAPFKGRWVVPGGLVKPRESVETAATRHILAKAGVRKAHLEQLATFGGVDRDPRGRVVSVAYMALMPHGTFVPRTTGAYKEIRWFPVAHMPKLGYDHHEIVAVAVDRLRAKVGYTNIIYSLLPDEFSLSELRGVYEMILGHAIDKRNFQKKMMLTGLIKKTSRIRRGEAHRPAQLYAFISRRLKIIDLF